MVARLAVEAVRLFRRYENEVVRPFGLCPWAKSARELGTFQERVVLDPDQSLATLDELAADETCEVAVLLYPRLAMASLEFERFVGGLREQDAARHPLGAIPFAMAAFHPHARANMDEPERLIPFLRRTPDPTIQVVRSAVLERVRGSAPQGTSFVNVATFDITSVAQPPLRERIARTNFHRVVEVGLDQLTRRLDDIRRDRDDTYTSLAHTMEEP